MSWQNITQKNQMMKSLKLTQPISELISNHNIINNQTLNNQEMNSGHYINNEEKEMNYPCINICYQQSLDKILFQKFLNKHQKTLLSLYKNLIIPYLKETNLLNFKFELLEIYFEKFCNLAYKYTKY